ncbi:Protein scribble homolog [Geodia barretti]|uniref:Protein scribble homolog n=1 Tax=Geodia barretti TaxID=519541 RepID=A0AA35TJI2_GEOBA|nr:Protein scribble homolog [Geodia barretti]
MGGNERPFHVFRQGDKPGIFILMVTPDGAAAKTGKLRTGDRILKVNGTDVSTATHDQAIRLLKTSSDPLSLCVRHEPAPPGLQELTLVTKPGEGFGLSLSGGVNGYHGNPLDETDEGLFISQVIPGGTAERDGRLREGTRILQVCCCTVCVCVCVCSTACWLTCAYIWGWRLFLGCVLCVFPRWFLGTSFRSPTSLLSHVSPLQASIRDILVYMQRQHFVQQICLRVHR